MNEVHNLLFSPEGVVATGLLTAAIAHNLLYAKNLYSWKLAEIDKTFKPRYTDFRYHATEYIAHVKRIGTKQKTYSNVGDWRAELGVAADASPVAALSKVEKLIDAHNATKGIKSQMQLAALIALKNKILGYLDVRSARMRLKQDQQATNEALSGKSIPAPAVATASPKHPISQALLNAKPLEKTRKVLDWKKVLGLTDVALVRPLTEDDLRAAYKRKKQKVNNNPSQMRILQEALVQGRKSL